MILCVFNADVIQIIQRHCWEPRLNIEKEYVLYLYCAAAVVEIAEIALLIVGVCNPDFSGKPKNV